VMPDAYVRPLYLYIYVCIYTNVSTHSCMYLFEQPLYP